VSETSGDFRKLMPRSDVVLDGYESALDYAFNDSDITNIALMGPYASGKSSIIRTYLKEHKISDCLFLSLSEFNTDDHEQDEGMEKLLEVKIVNQLIQKIDPKKVPKSSFRNIDKPVSVFSVILYFLLIVLSIGIILLVEDPFNLPGYVPVILIITAAMAILATILFLPHSPVNVRRVKLIDYADIELTDNDASCFDRYLDEIVYLVRNSGYGIIVIEDIDRFQTDGIFKRLREISNIINYNRTKKIKFVFELSDELFASESRSKFFDFIIPVTPRLWSNNVTPHLRERLGSGYSEQLLIRLSFFLVNQRTIDSICNECKVLEQFYKTDGSLDKLLAMVSFKNLYPRDYNDLVNHAGNLFAVLHCKESTIQYAIKDISTRINELNQLLVESRRKTMDVQSAFNTIRQLSSYPSQQNYDQITKIVNQTAVKELSPESIRIQQEIRDLEERKRRIEQSSLSELISRYGARSSNNDLIVIEKMPMMLVSSGYIRCRL